MHRRSREFRRDERRDLFFFSSSRRHTRCLSDWSSDVFSSDLEVAPYDEEELARLRVLGIDDPEDDPSVLVEGPEGTLRLWFQRVPEPKTSKNRTHLDLACEQDRKSVV